MKRVNLIHAELNQSPQFLFIPNIMSIPNITSTHEDFNEWLNQCPFMWFRNELTDEKVTYSFILPEEEDDDTFLPNPSH